MTDKEKILFKKWLKNAKDDKDLKKELKSIKKNEDEISDRFYRELEFGTAGIRGVLGAGTNRINIYIIRKSTQALSEYLKSKSKNPSVAISYDSRIKSDVFAQETASVLAANGVKAYIYRTLMPVPCLSYAVRELKCDAGVMVTASHNPAKYNGYKVYGNDGSQIREDVAKDILEISSNIDPFEDIKRVEFEDGLNQGLIEFIDQSVIDKYYDNVLNCLVDKDIFKKSDIKIVYTPLNGAGNIPVREVLSKASIERIWVVKEQEKPDGTFKTCPYPNPEIEEALELGLRDCKMVKPDLLIATDPDADRMGIAVPNNEGEYELLTGNETGVLMFEYICSQRKAKNTMPKNPLAVKTIVSTKLIEQIAKVYGVTLKNVLTGFKYIGEQILMLEEKSEENRFIFGFEESYGYLAGTFVRDKDAVMASLLICEVCEYYKKKGMTLLDALKEIKQKYGAFENSVDSYTFEGASGMEKMQKIMEQLRNNPPLLINNSKVVKYFDYKESKEKNQLTNIEISIDLPKSDVLEYELDDNSSIIIRPSGTEPKIKIYYTTKCKTIEESKAKMNELKNSFIKILGI